MARELTEELLALFDSAVSSTARMIPYLMDRLPTERKKRYWTDEEREYLQRLVDRMIGDPGEEAFLNRVLPLLPDQAPSSRRLRLGGEYYALRKRWFDRRTNGALEESLDQVLSLGAGFDVGIHWMAQSHPGADWFVVDQPATLQSRRDVWPPEPTARDNLHLISATLGRESLRTALEDVGAFNPERPTLILLEALLMYLKPAEVTTLLDELSDLLDGSGRLVGTVLGEARGGPLYREELNFAYWNCLLVEEPLRWTPTEEELRGRLANSGFRSRLLQTSQSWTGAVHPDSHPDVTPFRDQEYAFVAEPEPLITI